MWGGEGPCLILLGTAKDDFSRLSKGDSNVIQFQRGSSPFSKFLVRDHFEESISNYKRLESIRKELIHPKSMRSVRNFQTARNLFLFRFKFFCFGAKNIKYLPNKHALFIFLDWW